MEFALLGWPEDEVRLRLDYRRFSYAGKFVMSNSGKAVVRRRSNDHENEGDESVDGPIDVEPIDDPIEEGTTETRRRSAANDDSPLVDPNEFDENVLAAVAFNQDRTDPGVLWLRYVTVRDDLRGEGLGSRLAAFVTERARKRGFRRVRIAVNNPFAYEALYKAGFAYTGRQTGLAELVLEFPGERDRPTYQCGLDVYRERDLSDIETEFLDAKEGIGPPELVEDAPDPSESR